PIQNLAAKLHYNIHFQEKYMKQKILILNIGLQSSKNDLLGRSHQDIKYYLLSTVTFMHINHGLQVIDGFHFEPSSMAIAGINDDTEASYFLYNLYICIVILCFI
ncbi:hypothetical protein ACJX0J_009234, partial [Zea mays]